MSYTVLARKYRPQTFAELVGQDHIAQSLKNAIESERVAHAFLFTGVRGVGKTTSARLLAKALNCEKGPTHSPCNECDICTSITTGTDLDVLEIDGASNNSVDDVRKLQESLPYRPSKARFKVVIVDEVHMLSQGAFNAFLKTLEEPPPHVKFIFATTEAHKVPTTIRSRCQRYDFRLISEKTIGDQLRKILQTENIETDEDSIILISREAQGSMRDALTIVDQLIALGRGSLKSAEVSSSLGLADHKTLLSTIEALLEKQPKKILESIDQAQQQGADPLYFTKQIARLIRDLVLIQTLGEDTTHVDIVTEEREKFSSFAKNISALELQRTFDNLMHLIDDIGKSAMAPMALEMGLLSIASRPKVEDLSTLLEKIEQLSKGFSPSNRAHIKKKVTRSPTVDQATNSINSFDTAKTRTTSSINKSAKPTHQIESTSFGSKEEKHEHSRKTPSAEDIATSTNTPVEKEAEDKSEDSAQIPPSPPLSIHSLDDLSILQRWEHIVTKILAHKPALGVILKHAVPKEINLQNLHIQFQNDFYVRQVEQPEARKILSETAHIELGGTPSLQIEKSKAPDPSARSIAFLEKEKNQKQLSQTKENALSHPAVRKTKDFFPEADEIEVVVEETTD